MIPSLPLLFLLLVVVDSARIDPQLNEELQANCGKMSFQRKIINGYELPPGLHPWAINLYVKLEKRAIAGPGIIVSPRHILAYNVIRSAGDHLFVVDQRLQGNGVCEGSHLILPAEANQMFTVGHKENKTLGNSVERVIVVNGCETLGKDNLLILELSNDLKMHMWPVCLSNSADNWKAVDMLAVHGLNSSGILGIGLFSPVSCSARFPFSCATTTTNMLQGLCRGDFGGSAVAFLDHRHTVLGIYAKGNIDCNLEPSQDEKYEFINIGHFTDAICSLTGICVIPPLEQVKTSTEVGEAIFVTEKEGVKTTETPVQGSTAVGEAILVTESSSNATENILNRTDPVHVGSIVAETFEKMKLKELCEQESKAYGEHFKNLHIHVHLNGW